MKTKPIKCLFPDCERENWARGLCHSHYQWARHLIDRGQVTEEQLVAAGKMRKRKRGYVTDWFLDGINKDEGKK